MGRDPSEEDMKAAVAPLPQDDEEDVSEAGTKARRARPDEDRHFVASLARGLSLLRAFDPRNTSLSNKELAERTGLSKSTVARFTLTLTRLGYLVYDPRLRRYELGPPVLSLGFALLSGHKVRRMARPHMREIAQALQVTSALTARDGVEMVLIEVAYGARFYGRPEIGMRLPIHNTATGLAYLMGLPPVEQRVVMHALRGHLGTDWSIFTKRYERAREEFDRYGYVSSIGERIADTGAVAVPVGFAEEGHLLSMNCGGSVLTFTQEIVRTTIGPRLVETARSLNEEIGRR